MKSSLYYFPYWFPGIIMQINSRQEVERTSEMFMLYFSRGRIVNNLLQTLNLWQGNIKLLVASWAPLRYYFNRSAEVSVAMGEWATVNFCPCIIMYSPYISPLTSDFYLIYWWMFTYKYIYPFILNLW
jgi:hypothetical protein